MQAPPVSYRRDVPLDASAVATLFDASGIRRPTGDLARIGRMLAHSNLVFTAWHGNELVDLARRTQ